MTSTIRRMSAVTAAAAVAVLAFAAPATAHVRSDGNPVPQGGFGIVRLIVPGESATAATVGLTVTLPEGVDLTSARTLPVSGWASSVERDTAGRVAKIVWTATDPAAGYSVDEFREFAFSAGPWPEDGDSITLPSDQAYSDGSVVSWNEVAVDAASEPEHPAPEVALVAATDAHGHGESASGGHDEEAVASSSSDSSNVVWQTISVVSLVLAVAAVTGLGLVLRRGRGTGS